MKKFLFLLLSCVYIANTLSAQAKNKYGYPLSIVSDVDAYLGQIEQDSNKALIEIRTRIPNIVLDIRYATENNFLKKPFYKEAKAFARLPVVKALAQAQAELNAQGIGIKIYDGYRPYAITVQFYESFPDSMYVASPWGGSKHNRGCALDMTLVDLKTGNELAMPTPYDAAVKESWANAPVKDKIALKNRELMKAVMKKYGFTVDSSEWWHYNFDGWKAYELMDMSFETLSKLPSKLNYERKTVKIKMRDGVSLNTLIFIPKNPKEAMPFLLTRTPYGVNGGAVPELVNPSLATEGFIFVRQDVRGRYASEGQFEMIRMSRDKADKNSIDESTDTYDTIDWLLKNIPNNNGKAGIFGISYAGWTSIITLIEPHPALKAVSEQATIADWFLNDDIHHNGAFRLSYAFDYSFMEEASKTDTLFPFGQYDTYDWFMKLGPLSNVNDKYFHNTIPSWNNFVKHPDYDDYWKKQSLLYRFENINLTVPIQHVAGWFDQEDFAGPLYMYDLLEKKDKNNLNNIVIGPWNHGGWARGSGKTLGNLKFDTATSKTFQEQIELKWFAYYLKGKGDGKFAEAITFQTGSNTWKNYDKWTPQQATSQNLYFQNNGKLSFDKPVDMAETAFDAFISDPAHPVPYRQRPIEQTYNRGSRWYTWMSEDQRFVHDRPDVLSWETDILDKDITVTGNVMAHLFASTSQSDADWVVKLIDVYPEDYAKDFTMSGYQQIVTADILRGRYRNSFEKPEAVKPNEVNAYNVNLFKSDHCFKKGHKIMVQVQSTWFPMIDRNPQKYVPNIFLAKAEDYVKAEHRVYRRAGFASFIELSVMK
jgi:uncharacterized protein